MSDVSIPHFNFPFRFKTVQGVTAADVVEQDTLADVTNCVTIALMTDIGARITKPEFGITDPTFELDPIAQDLLAEEVLRNEPRADIIMDQAPDVIDPMILRLRAEVGLREDHSA